jgi:four helix bundle protein
VDKSELQRRTKAFALRVLKLVDALPRTPAGRAISNQLVRSAMSVGANYRAACRARSRLEFAAKLGTVLEEADESLYWLEMIRDGNPFTKTKTFTAVARSRRTNRYRCRRPKVCHEAHI